MTIKKPKVPNITAMKPDYFSEKGKKGNMDYFYREKFLYDSKAFLKRLSTKIHGLKASCVTTDKGSYVFSGEQHLWLLLSDQTDCIFGLKVSMQQISQKGRDSDDVCVLLQYIRVKDGDCRRKYALRRKDCPASIQKLAQGTVGVDFWFPRDLEITVDNVAWFVNDLAESIWGSPQDSV